MDFLILHFTQVFESSDRESRSIRRGFVVLIANLPLEVPPSLGRVILGQRKFSQKFLSFAMIGRRFGILRAQLLPVALCDGFWGL